MIIYPQLYALNLLWVKNSQLSNSVESYPEDSFSAVNKIRLSDRDTLLHKPLF